MKQKGKTFDSDYVIAIQPFFADGGWLLSVLHWDRRISDWNLSYVSGRYFQKGNKRRQILSALYRLIDSVGTTQCLHGVVDLVIPWRLKWWMEHLKNDDDLELGIMLKIVKMAEEDGPFFVATRFGKAKKIYGKTLVNRVKSHAKEGKKV